MPNITTTVRAPHLGSATRKLILRALCFPLFGGAGLGVVYVLGQFFPHVHLMWGAVLIIGLPVLGISWFGLAILDFQDTLRARDDYHEEHGERVSWWRRQEYKREEERLSRRPLQDGAELIAAAVLVPIIILIAADREGHIRTGLTVMAATICGRAIWAGYRLTLLLRGHRARAYPGTLPAAELSQAVGDDISAGRTRR